MPTYQTRNAQRHDHALPGRRLGRRGGRRHQPARSTGAARTSPWPRPTSPQRAARRQLPVAVRAGPDRARRRGHRLQRAWHQDRRAPQAHRTILAEIYNGKITKWNALADHGAEHRQEEPDAAKTQAPEPARSSRCSALTPQGRRTSSRTSSRRPKSTATVPGRRADEERDQHLAHTPSYGVCGSAQRWRRGGDRRHQGLDRLRRVQLHPAEHEAGGRRGDPQQDGQVRRCRRRMGIAADAAKHPDISPSTTGGLLDRVRQGATAYPISGYTWAVVLQGSRRTSSKGTCSSSTWTGCRTPARGRCTGRRAEHCRTAGLRRPSRSNIQALARARCSGVKRPANVTLLTSRLWSEHLRVQTSDANG